MGLQIEQSKSKNKLLSILSNLTINPFLTALALWAVCLIPRVLVNPGPLISSVPLSPFLFYTWVFMTAASGLLIMVGLAVFSTRLLASGCALSVAGCLIMATSFLFNPIIDGFWSGLTYLFFALAALIRLNHLIRGEMLIWIIKEK